jgi:hypothetical protein
MVDKLNLLKEQLIKRKLDIIETLIDFLEFLIILLLILLLLKM